MDKIQEIKQKVARLLEERGISQNAAATLIGYERTYLTQFINRDTPKRLSDRARRRLATLLEVPEQELTDEDLSSTPIMPASIQGITSLAKGLAGLLPEIPNHARLSIVDVTACCGNGSEAYSEKKCGEVSIPMDEFKSITNTSPDKIKLVKASGDSMDPTIKDGDLVWIDTANNFINSDGIYLLRMPTGLAIKRVQSGLTSLSVKSDNPKYSDITAEIGEVAVIGKAIYIWNGRKV
jgi:phage repressor protein C with HTH and peptisase S24 domain